MPRVPDYYQLLRVPPDADLPVIHAAYRRLARKVHPDVNPDSSAHERMRELNEALETLSDPVKRAEYDSQRVRLLSESAMAAHWHRWGPPKFVLPAPGAEGHLLSRVRRLPVAWLAMAGGVGITVVMATILTQLPSGSGAGGESSPEFVELGGLLRAEGRDPEESASEQPGESRPASSATGSSPGQTQESPGSGQALAGDEDSGGAGGPPSAGSGTPGSTSGSSSTPGGGTNAPTPRATSTAGATPPAGTPSPTAPPVTPTPGQPTPTPPPAPCSAAGTPTLNAYGNKVDFSNAAVVWFQAGMPGGLVVNVAGTVLRFEITAETDVYGDLSTATVVSGRGRHLGGGGIVAEWLVVVCPET